MCSIFQLTPGYTLPMEKLQNAVWNNPHGYGILIKDGNGKIKEIKKLDQNGTNPDEVYKILKDNEDTERFVHLRWATQGAISEENVQPFCVFSSRKRDVYFMHNGTLYGGDWTAPTQAEINAGKVDPMPGASDSRRFAAFLEKLFQQTTGDQGKADYEDDFIQDLIFKYWGSGPSKGLIVSSDLDPLFMNLSSWKLIKTKDENGVESGFMASNDDYFDKLTRGFVFEAKKKEEEEKKEAERKANSVPMDVVPIIGVERLKDFPSFSQRFCLSEEIVDILEDYDLYSSEGCAALSAVSLSEFEAMTLKAPGAAAGLLFQVTNFLKQETDKVEELEARLTVLEKDYPEDVRRVHVG